MLSKMQADLWIKNLSKQEHFRNPQPATLLRYAPADRPAIHTCNPQLAIRKLSHLFATLKSVQLRYLV
jgi:hypothetical protein